MYAVKLENTCITNKYPEYWQKWLLVECLFCSTICMAHLGPIFTHGFKERNHYFNWENSSVITL
jgi:hypothetical protein